uniref:Protein of unassigned function n=1 Tax=Ascaris lumbricoides TaxID=6252 RepID=A0A0M3HK27_ASCLU
MRFDLRGFGKRATAFEATVRPEKRCRRQHEQGE